MENLRILIAEDDLALADLWQKAFRKHGYEVDVVGNGNLAIDWLIDNPLPHVLIVDYHMPEKNGLDVIRTLHALDGGHAVTTVMATADHLVERMGQTDHIDIFLQKPVGFTEMKTLVERLTRHHGA
jgi:DNA-binding response OmpR family regulator